jgi:hypothetical protein
MLLFSYLHLNTCHNSFAGTRFLDLLHKKNIVLHKDIIYLVNLI